MGRSVWLRAGRPEDFVEATRWVFALLVMATLVFALPSVLAEGDRTTVPVGLASAVVLFSSWGTGYLRREAPPWMDAVDAVAFLGFAVVSADPLVLIALIMPALWFRSLYGSTRRALARGVIFAGTISASARLWGYLPGHTAKVEVPLLAASVIPPIFLTVIAGTQLAGGLRARGQAAQRDAVHLSLGFELLGVTQADEIRRIAWTAVTGICAVTPGLRIVKVFLEGAVLRVDGATGGFVGIPASLPPLLVSAPGSAGGDDQPGRQTAFTEAGLDAATGTSCVWVCEPLSSGHSQHGPAWLLVGAPRKVPAVALIAVRTLVNHVTLALQNGAVHERLTLLAEVDNLTGLANRASFNAGLAADLCSDSPSYSTILFVDLDDFKHVNDTFGHGAGDDLLREIATRIRRATRPGDLCARLGGDEFAVLLRGASGAVAGEVAQRIVATVGSTVQISGGTAHVGASVGVATATSETDFEELLHRADVAMYAAKAQGKARVQVFEPGLLAVDSTQVLVERQLASAARNGELVVHYQPVLSLADGRCTAVEALVRWQHPERGLLYPDTFIDTAERTGAIGDIGAYVLRRAIADTAGWREDHPGHPLSIHVNISGLQLHDDDFIDVVTSCLREFSLPPDQLVLEITETTVISSPAAIERLNVLAAHGVTIAIDDFGTGYSALTTLRSLPAQVVKIDRSFVAGCPQNSRDRAVIEAVVQMAAQMGMQTIAEGVERLDQQEFLERIGADAAQGFLYLRPTTAEAFSVWLRTHIADRPQVRTPRDVVVPFSPRVTHQGSGS